MAATTLSVASTLFAHHGATLTSNYVWLFSRADSLIDRNDQPTQVMPTGPYYTTSSSQSDRISGGPDVSALLFALKLLPFLWSALCLISSAFLHSDKRASQAKLELPSSFIRRIRDYWAPFVTEQDVRQHTLAHQHLKPAQADLSASYYSDLQNEPTPAQSSDALETSALIGFRHQRARVNKLIIVSLLQSLTWIVRTGWDASLSTLHRSFSSISTVSGWIFLFFYLFLRPPQTPPVTVVVLIFILTICALVDLFSFIPLLFTQNGSLSLSALLQSQAPLCLFDTLLDLYAGWLCLSMPIAPGGYQAVVDVDERMRHQSTQPIQVIPSAGGNKLKETYRLCPTSPEDYCTLYENLSYSWMAPIQSLALKRSLTPTDVWRLRSINDTRLLFQKFKQLDGQDVQQPSKKPGLLSKILRANANDILLDAFFKLVGVSFAYLGTYILKSILDEIQLAASQDRKSASASMQVSSPHTAADQDVVNWTPRQRAFVYAFIGLCLTVIRFLAELQNFHHARQVGLRLRSTLVVSLFEKALKRRDLSGQTKTQVATKNLAYDNGSDVTDFAPAQQDGLGVSSRDSPSNGPPNSASTVSEMDQNSADHAILRSRRSWTDSFRRLDLKKLSYSSLRSRSRRRAAISPGQARVKLDQKQEKHEEQGADVGKVVNMMASDVNILLRMGCDLHQLYGAPLEVTIAAFFLYKLMGWSALVGFAILVAAIPINYFWGEVAVSKQREYSSARDERMSLMTELINAMRFVKMQGLEIRWQDRVADARRQEIYRLIWSRFMTFLFELLWTTIPVLVTFVSFFFYVKVAQQELTVATAFTAIALFTMIRPPLNAIPGFLMGGLIALVSVQRLESFLTEQEVDEAVSQLSRRWKPDCNTETYKDNDPPASLIQQPDDVLSIQNGTFHWHTSGSNPAGRTENESLTADDDRFELRDISVDFPAGKLSVVTGPTGSGKSSLLAALLGEMLETSQGSVQRSKFDPDGKSRMSFASQLPWLEAGKSVRDNITFITPFESQRYNSVVHACALEEDIASMSDGDQTQIGSHTVSGGQKARISLARALYARTHTVLLDDVLSAVDARVQNHIVTHALNGTLAAGRRIVIVTHHDHLLLDTAALLVRMQNGRIAWQGSPSELLDKDLPSRSQVQTKPNTPPQASRHEVDSATTLAQEQNPPDRLSTSQESPASGGRTPKVLFDDEKRREGAVSWVFYRTYLRASSMIAWALLVLFLLLLRSADSFGQYWLKVWGEAYRDAAFLASASEDALSTSSSSSFKLPFDLPSANGHAGFYLTVYGLTGLAVILFNSTRSICFYVASIQASQNLFTELLANVVRAPLRWFDVTPPGRIMNRFGTDMDCIDNILPQSIMNLGNNAFSIAAYFLICVVIVPWFLIPSFLLVVVGPWLVSGFLACTRDMQRIEATSTSPIYDHFQQALSGIMTIRAFGAEPRMVESLLDAVDLYQSLWWAVCTMEVWLSFRSQILGGLSVFVVTLLALSGAVSPGSAGLALSSAQLLCQLAYYLVNDFKNLANSFNSLERVAEYQTMTAEESTTVVSQYNRTGVPDGWPTSSARIVFDNVRLRYAPELPDVLKGISFEIQPGEKVGVIGRTGSGKSSLASSLLRATELNGGKIVIDDIDIKTIPLHELRTRLSIVMQDPVLFSGTLRDNLDPFKDHSDEDILAAMRKVGLTPHRPDQKSADKTDLVDTSDTDTDTEIGGDVQQETGSSSMDLHLNTPVSSGGANFSAGQAQLISLARSLLRNARILILDEATSSTDKHTDAMIQRVIRTALDGCIVICIAHRLHSVIDYDRVLVMQDGKLVEFGSPKQLLSKSDADSTAHFKQLCKHSSEYQHLCAAAGVARGSK